MVAPLTQIEASDGPTTESDAKSRKQTVWAVHDCTQSMQNPGTVFTWQLVGHWDVEEELMTVNTKLIEKKT